VALYNQVEAIPVDPPDAVLGELNLDTPGVREIATTPVAAMLCPSDSGRSGCNYRVCVGPDLHEIDANPLHPDSGGKGPFTVVKEYPTGEFRDGMSNTVAMSERLKSDHDATRFAPREDVWFTGVLDLTGTSPPLDEMVSLCASLSVDPLDYYPHTGLSWMFGSYHHTWYNHAVTPNSKISDCSILSWSPAPRGGPGVYKASSHHPGGVNILFMDGRVQFTSDSIDLAVWRAISTRKGEEIVALSGP
jgi:prepilin-type processing-associated H-X9-DG protein